MIKGTLALSGCFPNTDHVTTKKVKIMLLTCQRYYVHVHFVYEKTKANT